MTVYVQYWQTPLCRLLVALLGVACQVGTSKECDYASLVDEAYKGPLSLSRHDKAPITEVGVRASSRVFAGALRKHAAHCAHQLSWHCSAEFAAASSACTCAFGEVTAVHLQQRMRCELVTATTPSTTPLRAHCMRPPPCPCALSSPCGLTLGPLVPSVSR